MLAAGIVAAYFLDKGLNDAKFAFPGMALAIAAIAVGALASGQKDQHSLLDTASIPPQTTSQAPATTCRSANLDDALLDTGFSLAGMQLLSEAQSHYKA